MASGGNTTGTSTTSSVYPSTNSQKEKDGSNKIVRQGSIVKMTDKSRKESPVDTNRRSAAPKAWQGPNPITQRATTPSQVNGNNIQTKPINPRMATSKQQSSPDVPDHERLRYMFAAMIGLSMVITTKEGQKYEGIMVGASGQVLNSICLGMTKRVQNAPVLQPNGSSTLQAAFVGTSPACAMSFELSEVADISIIGFSIPEPPKSINGIAADSRSTQTSTFKIDADIATSMVPNERKLQPWIPEAHDTTDYSLGSTTAQGWDQFRTHEEMTGLGSTYREEDYTTTIDRNAPDYKQREAHAARLAQEIEAQPSTNAYVREERGQTVENDPADEEDKYSGVKREASNIPVFGTRGPNSYMPPALRAPSAQPGVAGAPYDPAIMSSQLARPDGSRSRAPIQPQPIPRIESPESKQSSTKTYSPADDLPLIEKIRGAMNVTNGTADGAPRQKNAPPVSPSRPAVNENPSDGVEQKVLGAYKQFADGERERVAQKKREQATFDRQQKINELKRFSKTFKLKTPVPTDLVGILAKDREKQGEIVKKAQQEAEEMVKKPAPSASTNLVDSLPPVAKFDKSQIPPPIPLRNTIAAGQRSAFNAPAPGRGSRPPVQQVFPQNAPSAPRGQIGIQRVRDMSFNPVPPPPTIPIPLPGEASGLSSPRGVDTPTSVVSNKLSAALSAGAPVFRPTTAAFVPHAATGPASPIPVIGTTTLARPVTPSAFFGKKKPIPKSGRLDVTKAFNAITRMTAEVKEKRTKDPKAPDYASNQGLPFAHLTQPTWEVAVENQERSYEDFFKLPSPVLQATPMQTRTASNQSMSYVQSQHSHGGHTSQVSTPHHHHITPHMQNAYEEQLMLRQQNAPHGYASPSMAPRGMYTPVTASAQIAYGHQYMRGGPVHMQQHGQHYHGQGAPMMVQQHSTGPFMAAPQQYGYNAYSNASPGYGSRAQHGGYPSPAPQIAPIMAHQNSSQGHHMGGHAMYPSPSQGGYNPQMRANYMGQQTPYGTSPHQGPYQMNRVMSGGYGSKMQMQQVLPLQANGAGMQTIVPSNQSQRADNIGGPGGSGEEGK